MITYRAEEVVTGFHPEGYRIDRTTAPKNHYTRWKIDSEGNWVHPKPVTFHSMPEEGWLRVKRFEWDTK